MKNVWSKKLHILSKRVLVILLAVFTVLESFFLHYEQNEVKAANPIYKFDYTGEYQEFVAPETGTYKVQLWGAQGGTSLENNKLSATHVGGYGAYTAGLIELEKGQKLYIYVGGKGTNGAKSTIVPGGFNGGGRGDYDHADDEAAGGGGGATDIRLSIGEDGVWNDFESLKSRIMVAGGGGGSSWIDGLGYGGTLTSNKTSTSAGATQTTGYAFGVGQPGVYKKSNTTVGGGGGGYYGGLASNGTTTQTNGSGGSSFISGFDGSDAISEESTSTNIIHTGQSKHYSGLYFTNSIMISGNGYAETLAGLDDYEMPNPAGGTFAPGTGKTGNGYAVIEYLEVIEPDDFPHFTYGTGYEYKFSYTGDYQTFTAPYDGVYKLEAWGGKGGSGMYNSSAKYAGGAGAYTSGEIHLNKGDTIYVYVGQAGYNGRANCRYCGGYGGWNGGAQGGNDANHDSSPDEGGGGGGATDFRLVSGTWNDFESLKSRIMIAAGGGGSTYSLPGYAGGIDLNDINTYAFAQGQKGFAADTGSGGGGGGYFGGISVQSSGGRGYGGTSYVSGSTDDLAISPTSTSDNIVLISSSAHYSGIVFDNPVKIAGDTSMPTWDGKSTMVGNANNGYAKITILSIDEGAPKLENATVSGGVFSQTFDPDNLVYDVLVDSENTNVTIDASVLYDTNEIFRGLGNLTLKAGTTSHYIGVISETGEVNVYTLNITRPASSYKYLEDLSIDGSTISSFDPETFSYTVNLPAEKDSVVIDAVLGRPSQQINGLGELTIGFGETSHIVEVVSEDGNSLTNYTIKFVKPSSSKLRELSVNGFLLNETFDPDVYNYTVDVPNGVLSLDVNALPYDSSAVVTITGNGYLKRNNVITITVTQATAGTAVYTITVNIEGNIPQSAFEFGCTESYQEFEAQNSGYYKIELWGAQGGYGRRNNKLVNPGGNGAYTTGTLWLTKGEKIYVYVGCVGKNGASVSKYAGGLGGYNGGGQGGDDANHDSAPDSAGGGGGATDIRLVPGKWNDFDSLKSRIMIAAGGAGGTYGTIGYAGGLYLNKTNTYSFAVGQKGFAATSGSGGGGGGYFGGSSPQTDGGRGFGGTSYISGLDGMLSISEESTEGNVILTDSSIHYSGIVFTNAEAIDGSSSMPSKTDGYTTGNTGNGYARITLLPYPSENNYLSSLTVKANDEEKTYTPSFDLETLDYYLTVGVDETRVVISAKPDDSTAIIEGLGEHIIVAGENIIPITVTAENGDVRVYNVHITRPISNNPYPNDIIISGLVPSLCSVNESFCSLEPATFDKETNSYYLTVPSRIKQLWFNVEKGHEFQTVSGEGKVSLDGGENVITIEIESEDKNNITVYKYYVIRDMTGNTDLSKLDILDPEREINYDPDITEYYLSVPNDYTSIASLDIVTDDPSASYVVVGNENFVTGMNQVSIIVTAQNGETKTYVLNVYREQSSNVYLSDLQVKFGENIYELTPEFNKLFTGTYQATVPNDVTAVEIIGLPEVDTTTVIGVGEKILNTGNNKFTITTTAEDGSLEVYTLIVYREKNSNTNLTDLTVKLGENVYTLDPTFSNDVLEYYVDVEEGLSKIEISAIPEVETTKYKLLDNNIIKVGTNKKRVMVIAEDGTTKIITIYINRNANSNNYLSDITLTAGKLSPVFDKEVNDYVVEVGNEVNTITITGVKEHTLSTVKGNGKYSLQVGQNEISLVVKAEDGVERIYNINVVRLPNSNGYLSSITSSVGTLSPIFNKETFEYTINVENLVDNIKINAVTEVKTTTVKGTGNYSLVSGNNVITLTTLAEDGVTTYTYTVNVVRDKSDNDNLKTLIVKEGILSPKFDPNIISYVVNVPNEVTKGNFIVELEDNAASYEIIRNDNFVVGDNEVTIRVTSESGLTKDYIVNVIRQEVENNSNYLTNITTNKGVLSPSFNKETLFYEIVVPYATTNITVNAVKEDLNANLTGVGTYTLSVGNNIIGLSVVSIDGKVRDYQLLVVREKNAEARLSSLVINGIILNPNFDKDIYEYSLNTTLERLDFTKIQTVDSNATYEVFGNENLVIGNNKVTIRVTAQDGVTHKEYVLNVTKNHSNNNNLSALSVVGYDIVPVFNKTTTLYTLTVPNDVNSVTIEATCEHPLATIIGDGSQVIEVGENQLVVEVTSESGLTKAYTILVTKEGNDNNNIKELIVNNGVISPEFTSSNLNYNVLVPYEEDSLDLTVVLEHEGANYRVIDNNFDVGNNSVKVVVTAENGEIKTYTLNVTRQDIQSALLKNLSIKNYSMDKVFNPYVTNYDVTIDNEITMLDLNIETLDKNATYVVSGNEDFEIGMNVITIVVTSSDLVTTETYTINVNRQMYSNTFLDYLYTSEGDVVPSFDKNNLSYSIDVNTDVSTIELFAEAVDGSAVVVGTGEHSLQKGENIFPIKVTSASGVARTYYVTVNRAKSGANYLEDLKVKAGGITYILTPEFDRLVNDYALTLPAGISNVVLEGVVSEGAIASGLGTVSIVGGINNLSIKVTSESGDVNVYNLVITRELSSNNHLTDLIPSVGTLSPEFNYTKTDYTLNLDSGAGVLGFTYYTEDLTAIVTGAESLVVPDGTSTRVIKVTAEDGSVREYTITVNKERTDNAKLSNLYVNGYSFDETFDSDVYEYHLTVPNSKKMLLASDVVAITADSNASVSKMGNINLSTSETKDFIITVTAPDGFTIQQYKIVVTREKSTTSSLASLAVMQGYLETKFNPNVFEYSWKIPKELSLVLDDYVLVSTQDSTSTVTMTEQIDMKSSDEKVFIVRVTAEDGSRFVEYKLNVSYDLSTDATLKQLIVDKGYYLPELNPDIFEYDIYEYVDETEINITAIPTSDTSVITQGGGNVVLDSDNVEHIITVTAEDGSIQNYVIRIHRSVLIDKGLNYLGLNGLDTLECIGDKCILSPNFETTTYEYSIKVPYEYLSLDVLVKKMNDQQTVKYKINDEYKENYELPLGTTKVLVEVYDGMGIKTSEYILNIERCRSNNNNLLNLEVSYNDIETVTLDLNPIFDKGILEYEVQIPSDIEEVDIIATPEDKYAMVKINGHKYLAEGNNDATITVTASDGSEKTYIVHIIRTPEYNSYIKNITVSTGMFFDLKPGFKQTIFDYSVTVPGIYETVTVEAVPVDPNTVITGTGEFDIKTGLNVVTLTATAIDGSTSTYTLNITKELNRNVNLSNLIVAEANLNPVFEPSVTKYELIIPSSVDKLTIYPVLADKNSSYIITGNENLIAGDNIVNIIVMSEDKSVAKTYQLTVHKLYSTNNYLSNIIVKDDNNIYELEPPFNKETEYYDIKVGYTVEKVTIDATKEDENALVIGIGEEYLDYGLNQKTITVTAEDGSVKNYVLNIYRSYNLDLKDIISDIGTIYPEFDEDILEYEMTLPSDECEITFIAQIMSDRVNVAGSGTYQLQTGENNIIFTVEDPLGNTKEYKVVITKEASTNNYIESLVIHEGVISPVFDKETLEYEVSVRNTVTSVGMDIVLEDETASYEVIGNGNFKLGDNEVIIRVTAESGDTRDYKINVILQEDSYFSNRLLELNISEGKLTPDFNPDVNYYAATVPNSVENLIISAIKENVDATVIGLGLVNLELGRNIFQVEVTSRDGIVNTYTISIYREENSDATLSSLVIKNHSYSPLFNKLVTEYELTVGSEVSKLDIEALPTDSKSTVEIIGNDLELGENTVTIKVTAPDKVTTKEYILKVEKVKSTNNYLSSLKVNGYSLTPVFDKLHQGPYVVNVSSEVNTVVIDAVAEVSTTTITGDGAHTLSTGQNVIEVSATSESGSVRTYTVVVNKSKSSNNDLENIILSDGMLDPLFNKDILEYKVVVPEELELITVTGKAATTSTVVGNGTYKLTENNLKVELVVYAEDGSEKTYTVNIEKEIKASSKILSLIVKDGQLYPEFHKNTTSYTVLVPYEVTNLNMDVVLEDNLATYTVTGNSNFKVGNNTVNIVVTATSGEMTTYTINAIRQVNASNYLKDLSVVGYTLVPIFDKTTLYYEVKVPNIIDEIEIKATKEDVSSTLSGTGYKVLNYGKNTFYITVTSTSGSVRTYTVVVNRALEEENLLLTLNSDIGVLSPEFNPYTNEYELNLPEKTESITLTGTSSFNTTVTGLGSISISKLQFEHSIVVTSQSGETNTYKINIKRASSSNTELDSLEPSFGSLEYSNEVTEYTMEVEDNVTTLSFTAVPTDSNAKVTGTDLVNLNYGENVINITVTAEDGVTTRNITVKVMRMRDLTSIIPSVTELILKKDEVKQITYALDPLDTSYPLVEWVVVDETVASVDENGNVKGLEVGYTTVKIVSKHNPLIYASITIYVIETEITSAVYDINRSEETKYVIGINPKTKLQDFIPNFDNNQSSLHVFDSKGVEIIDLNQNIGTSMTIKLIINDVVYDELTIVVRGDINGDGFVTVADQTAVKNIILGKVEKTFINQKAADVTIEGMITVADMTKVKNYILGKVTSLNE